MFKVSSCLFCVQTFIILRQLGGLILPGELISDGLSLHVVILSEYFDDYLASF